MAIFDSRRSEGAAVINAFKIWDKSKGVSAATVGPASSGPTARAQQVFSVREINLPQISYCHLTNFVRHLSVSTSCARHLPTAFRARSLPKSLTGMVGAEYVHSPAQMSTVPVVSKNFGSMR